MYWATCANSFAFRVSIDSENRYNYRYLFFRIILSLNWIWNCAIWIKSSLESGEVVFIFGIVRISIFECAVYSNIYASCRCVVTVILYALCTSSIWELLNLYHVNCVSTQFARNVCTNQSEYRPYDTANCTIHTERHSSLAKCCDIESVFILMINRFDFIEWLHLSS